ncbi:hypothetical protein EZS27_018445 [termite gut metagenome]|uniref:DNA-binding protein n=1 Tax=termite gut metagenome TaxID=433724 RepID=A0A5J4RG89_9ZZZZ
MRTITLNEFQRIKNSLSIESIIANELNISVNCVQKFLNERHFTHERYPGIYFRHGPEGGLIMLDDDTAVPYATILNYALKILDKSKQ